MKDHFKNLQENSADQPVDVLRSVLQKIEKCGAVGFTVGGHTCARPPEVQQGKAPDSFTITPDEANPLLWRPQAVQVKNLKASNIASHFGLSLLNASPLVLAPQLIHSLFCEQFF